MAKLLLQKEAPVDAQGKNGVTPLHVASHYDHQNVALLLLDKGASPHATGKISENCVETLLMVLLFVRVAIGTL